MFLLVAVGNNAATNNDTFFIWSYIFNPLGQKITCVSLRVGNVKNRQSTLVGTAHIGVRVPETGRKEF